MRKCFGAEEEYRTWDFLKPTENSRPTPPRSQRKISPNENQRPSLNLFSLEDMVERSNIPSSFPDIPMSARIRGTPRSDHFRKTEDFGCGKWMDFVNDDDPEIAPFHQSPHATSKRHGYKTGLSRQDVMQERLRQSSGREYYQVLPIDELGPELKTGGRRHIQSPHSAPRMAEFLCQGDIVPVSIRQRELLNQKEIVNLGEGMRRQHVLRDNIYRRDFSENLQPQRLNVAGFRLAASLSDQREELCDGSLMKSSSPPPDCAALKTALQSLE
eukprot:TRINITY_DN9466_c0_g1_i4.p1 TRINITY_DN9466_c0_g1~~TRINITY_DN9466_c0_g1_i4.p1  ORF type:complete len:271 (-),score=56.10 TRINITY_DN9466_c0_g1_i4:93-905(-)